jgi:hypothetical protein
METLGLSDSTPRSESRIKSLFWPSIHSAADVDYLGTQGYWLCAFIAVVSLVALCFAGQALVGVLAFLMYYLGAVGVRERSPFAAALVLAMSIADILAGGPSVLRVIVVALLISNLRAAWIAGNWKPDSEEASAPPRLNETWGDKLADQLPQWLWPKIRIPYFIFAFILLVLAATGIVLTMISRTRY